MNWTIFGAGNLIYDIADAIASCEGKIREIVLNQPTSIDLSEFNTMSLEEYKGMSKDWRLTGHCLFGFNNPDKEEFLKEVDSSIFSNLYHTTNWISKEVKIQKGNFFGAHNVIASKVEIGNFNYFNRNSSIGHHTKIGSFNHIAPGATVCGKCKIGNKIDIGAGAVVIDKIEICDNVIIGAGAVVAKNIVEPGTYVGVPAKKLS